MSAKQFVTILGLSLVTSFLGGLLAVYLISVPSAKAQHAFFDALAVGTPLSGRGEMVRVKGWTVLGQAGVQGGQLTFMPPDGTGFYSIDNPGGHRLRFSGGGRPGQYEYMSISHPGLVRINGTLQVMGAIVDRNGQPFQGRRNLPQIPRAARGGGKDDAAGLSSLQVLRDELNAVWDELEQVRQRVLMTLHIEPFHDHPNRATS
ncbi:hypothetical protein GF1_12290 [Desulfolithobacter dissulfuricans]|uniref:Uncharacterized protein n=1 Tax=Desulfolithobacter dissulfuricans TaxID=2795293 RepID=A0A915TZY1_9BACT|nr:hypothetical protein [Desulfolithobacter dissulfuricans]BCO08853.1 hypothetical protein GF1_12290 [Desulfolithobacter dissulfuricans]